MDRAPCIINLQNISKRYSLRNWKTLLLRRTKTVEAIKDISLQVMPGEIMGIIGPNGAGKTTLLKILATLITPDSGQLSIAGIQNINDTIAIRKHIGYVNTNDRSFYWRLTGRENLEFFGHLYNLTGGHLKKRINEVIKLTDLTSRSSNPFATFSSGERQRLAIARAMLSEPDILLMDEATSNLDPIVSAHLIDFTKNILSKKLNKTIVWCTHNLREAEKICDRVAVLNQGTIISCMTIDEIKNSFGKQHKYRLVLSRIPSSIREATDFSEETHLTQACCTLILEDDIVPQIMNNLIKENIKIFECRKIEHELEDVFINLMNNQTQE